MVRHLQEQGLQADAFETEYGVAHEGNEGQDGHDGQGSAERHAVPEAHQTQPQARDSLP